MNNIIEDLKTKFTSDKVKAWLKELVETVFFVVVMVIIIRFFIGEIRWIPSASMHPTLLEGDRLFIERYSRFYRAPQRGDILVFYPPHEEIKNDLVSVFCRLTGFFCKDIAYIKRVVGLPGDKVTITTTEEGNTFVLINDKPLKEPYVKDVTDKKYVCNSSTKYCQDVIVPENSYFMMGDNRGNSQDSRYWGFLPKERIIGKAVFIFWPIKRAEYFKRLDY